PAQLKVGRRLAIKILNASRFVLSLSGPGPLTPPGSLTADQPGASAVGEPLAAPTLGRLGQGVGQGAPPGGRGGPPGALAAPGGGWRARAARARWPRRRSSSGSPAMTTWSWSRPGPTGTGAMAQPPRRGPR